MSDWKSCGNCGDRKCAEDMKKAGCYDLTTPCDDWSKLPCQKCGGILSEIRTNGGYPHRHCYGCHFEFEVKDD